MEEKRPQIEKLVKNQTEKSKEPALIAEIQPGTATINNPEKKEVEEEKVESLRRSIFYKLGGSPPPPPVTTASSEQNAPESNEPENKESEISPEMKRLKGNIDNLTFVVESTLRKLRERQDNNLTEFMDESEIGKLQGIIATLKEINVYNDHEFEETYASLNRIVQVIDSIDHYPQRRGINEDPESLQGLMWSIKEISKEAENLKFSAKQIDTPSAHKIAVLADQLSEISLQKRNFLHQKLEALEQYFGR